MTLLLLHTCTIAWERGSCGGRYVPVLHAQARHLQRYHRHHPHSIEYKPCVISSMEAVLGVIVFAGVGPVVARDVHLMFAPA